MKTETEHSLQVASLDLTLDLPAQRVWLGDDELNLTAREFEVLRYLVDQPGCLVTTSQLLSAVWGTDQVIGDTALRTVIKRLRRKLGDDPKQPRYIITVWGRGYRFQ
jgi:DNA-binding response OmpR family regulator